MSCLGLRRGQDLDAVSGGELGEADRIGRDGLGQSTYGRSHRPRATRPGSHNASGCGAVLGQVAVDTKSNEIPAVRELLKAFTDLAGAVITAGALHTQSDTAQAITGPARRLRDDNHEGHHAGPVQAAEEAALDRDPRLLSAISAVVSR
jgi:hypothetical protein